MTDLITLAYAATVGSVIGGIAPVAVTVIEHARHMHQDIVWEGDGSSIQKWKYYLPTLRDRHDWNIIVRRVVQIGGLGASVALLVYVWIIGFLQFLP
jgi:hypothetical protein